MLEILVEPVRLAERLLEEVEAEADRRLGEVVGAVLDRTFVIPYLGEKPPCLYQKNRAQYLHLLSLYERLAHRCDRLSYEDSERLMEVKWLIESMDQCRSHNPPPCMVCPGCRKC